MFVTQRINASDDGYPVYPDVIIMHRRPVSNISCNPQIYTPTMYSQKFKINFKKLKIEETFSTLKSSTNQKTFTEKNT